MNSVVFPMYYVVLQKVAYTDSQVYGAVKVSWELDAALFGLVTTLHTSFMT